MDIIPVNDQLIIDARLPVQDIGYIEIGQMAVISLASADGQRFKQLDGEVTFISPDSIIPQGNNPSAPNTAYYKIRIMTYQNYFEGDGQKYHLYPGVQVSVSILTGSRSIISYLFDPFLRSLKTSLKER